MDVSTRAAAAPVVAATQRMRRRPPCRDSGGDERSLELAARMVEHGRAISSRHRDLLGDIAEFDRGESWRGDGAVSMVAWVMERCGVSGATARVWVRAAGKLESLPHLASALADGVISLDVLAPLADIATPANDADLAAASVHWTVKQARELADSRRGPTDSAEARKFEHRSLRFNDEKCTFWAAFTKDDYAEAKAALVARVSWRDEHGESGRGADPLGYVTYDQRLYDAFMGMCRDDGTSSSGGGSGSGSESGSRTGSGSGGGGESGRTSGFRPTVVVHADLGLLTGLNPDGIAEIAGVGPVSREVARRLACDAKVVFSLERSDGCILDQKRARRSPTTAQRIEIARRDKGCRFGSCSFTEFTHVHHIVHWTGGGETNLSNLITLCGRHHQAVHELGWSMSGSADGVVTFEGPHGHRITSAPSPTWRPVAGGRSMGQSPMRR